MNYYKDKIGQIYYYNDLQVRQGLHEGKVALTEKELEEHLKPAEPVEVREVTLEELKVELTMLMQRTNEIAEKLDKIDNKRRDDEDREGVPLEPIREPGEHPPGRVEGA